jgi:hypothetical protein
LGKTLHPDIFRIENGAASPDLNLIQAIDSLSALSRSADNDAIIALLDELIPGSSIREMAHPDITSII